MSPSVAELSIEVSPIAIPVKSISERAITVESFPIEENSSVNAPVHTEEVVVLEAANGASAQDVHENADSKFKIRRVIDEEGGTTTASVGDKSSIASRQD